MILNDLLGLILNQFAQVLRGRFAIFPVDGVHFPKDFFKAIDQ